MFSLSKSDEAGSSSQLVTEASGGIKSEVKEEIELDPKLSAIPPPSVKSELEFKEEGFVRPKVLNMKYVLFLHILYVQVDFLFIDLWKKMFSKVPVVK